MLIILEIINQKYKSDFFTQYEVIKEIRQYKKQNYFLNKWISVALNSLTNGLVTWNCQTCILNYIKNTFCFQLRLISSFCSVRILQREKLKQEKEGIYKTVNTDLLRFLQQKYSSRKSTSLSSGYFCSWAH